VQKNEGVDCAIGGRTGTFCKDRARHALLSGCSTNERSAFIAVPLPFRGDEDRIGGSAICSTLGAEYVDRFICCQRVRES